MVGGYHLLYTYMYIYTPINDIFVCEASGSYKRNPAKPV